MSDPVLDPSSSKNEVEAAAERFAKKDAGLRRRDMIQRWAPSVAAVLLGAIITLVCAVFLADDDGATAVIVAALVNFATSMFATLNAPLSDRRIARSNTHTLRRAYDALTPAAVDAVHSLARALDASCAELPTALWGDGDAARRASLAELAQQSAANLDSVAARHVEVMGRLADDAQWMNLVQELIAELERLATCLTYRDQSSVGDVARNLLELLDEIQDRESVRGSALVALSPDRWADRRRTDPRRV